MPGLAVAIETRAHLETCCDKVKKFFMDMAYPYSDDI